MLEGAYRELSDESSPRQIRRYRRPRGACSPETLVVAKRNENECSFPEAF